MLQNKNFIRNKFKTWIRKGGMFFSFVANELCFKNALEIQEYIPSLPHILISSVTCDTVLHIAISSSFFFDKYMYTIHDCIMYIQSVPKKTLFYVFANISTVFKKVESRAECDKKNFTTHAKWWKFLKKEWKANLWSTLRIRNTPHSAGEEFRPIFSYI